MAQEIAAGLTSPEGMRVDKKDTVGHDGPFQMAVVMEPLRPSVSLLLKLGQIVFHANGMSLDDGHYYDLLELRGLIEDEEVQKWMEVMTATYLPGKYRMRARDGRGT